MKRKSIGFLPFSHKNRRNVAFVAGTRLDQSAQVPHPTFLAANSSCCFTAKFIPRMLVWSLFCQQSQILTLTSPVDIHVLTRSALALTAKDSLFHSFQIQITKTMFVNSLLYRQLRRLPEILILDWFSSLEFAFKSVPFFNSMARILVIVPFYGAFCLKYI